MVARGEGKVEGGDVVVGQDRKGLEDEVGSVVMDRRGSAGLEHWAGRRLDGQGYQT